MPEQMPPEVPAAPPLPRAAWPVRPARAQDIPALEALIPLSARGLQAQHYSAAQIEAALGPIFGVDRQLIADGTYFVVEDAGVVVGCGGWSRRRSLYGGDAARAHEDALLDPAHDAARIRAFFVHPAWARRGIGRCIMAACEAAIAAAGFATVEIVATLTGEPLYASFGYLPVERYELALAGGATLAAVRMRRSLRSGGHGASVVLRPYASADFDALVGGWHETNRASYPYNAEQQRHTLEGARAFFRAQVLPVCRVQVAERAGSPAGLLALEAPWIRHLAIFPAHQRQGIGSMLLAWARRESPRELRLFTFQRNAPARAFYERHGFRAVAFGVSPAPESEPDVEYRWNR